ncbi:MAG: TonB-dependent receptor [Bacteroidales bacterium]|nr:TonB-dependent receptor [Bacteroidales bacterium]
MRFSFLCMILYFQLLTHAQTGNIEGYVKSSKNNEPIPFATIQVLNTTTGSYSDFDGKFIIASIPPGFYVLRISAVGFKPIITQEIEVLNNKTVTLEFSLEEQSFALKEVQVTAEKFEKKLESPISNIKISASEIENSAGGNRDIARVIQNFPGVAAFPIANRNDIIVRGGSTSENRFFVDDIEIPYINHFATQGASGGTNSILNTDIIKNLDFLASSFPASRYNALSSVFEFKTKTPRETKPSFRFSIGASEAAFSSDGPIGEKTGYLFSIRRSYLALLFKALQLPFLPTFNDYTIKIRYKPDNRNEIGFLSLGALDVMKLDLNIQDPTEFQLYILKYLPIYSQWNYVTGISYRHFYQNGSLLLVLSRSMLNNSQIKYLDNIEDPSKKLLDYSSNEQENKFRIERTYRWPLSKIQYGLNIEYATYENKTFQKLLKSNSIDTLEFESNLYFWKYGVFLQTSREFFNSNLSITAGVRTDATTYSATMNNPFKQISPRIATSLKLAPKISWESGIGRYFQLPPYTTMGYLENGIFVNKKRLSYIQSTHVVSGFTYLYDSNIKITLEGFYKHYSKYPTSLTDGLSFAFKPLDYGAIGNEPATSISKGRAYGSELFAQIFSYDQTAYASISYTFAISEFKDALGNYRPTSWDNRHIFVVSAYKRFKKFWTFAFRWRYAGGLPYTPYDYETSSIRAFWDIQNRPYFDYSKLNGERFKPFHQLDIRIEKKFIQFKKVDFRLYLDIQNLYNFKAQELPRLTNLDPQGQPLIDPNDPQKYILREIPSDGTGTILPTIGVIIQL